MENLRFKSFHKRYDDIKQQQIRGNYSMSNHTDNNSYLDMGVANINDTSNY